MPTKNLIKKVKSAESAISMILGIFVIVVVGVLLFRYFRTVATKAKPAEKQAQESTAEKEEGAKVSLPAKYIVQKNDTLWEISKKFYGYGFNWIDISQENKITAPDKIEVGQELSIPDVPVRQPLTTKEASENKTDQSISEESYEVVKGDSLWKISVRAYQDGYKWQEIAKANNLANPNLIHPGNVLVIPR